MSLLRKRVLTMIVILAVNSVACAIAEGTGARFTPLVRAVQLCRKSVVNIHTEKSATDEKDGRFFTARPRRVSGMGTGIVVDERGYIVTNYHVIHEVDQITVTLEDGETCDGRPVSFDRSKDLAIIHIETTQPLPVMLMGTSSDLMLAEQVFAVGNAFGYEHTVTAGIISALSRDVEVDETQSYENLIQTDASINPGNSGGPLLNLDGEVIGVNVAIRAGAQRIGFAIPIDDARETIASLLSTERLNGVSHGAVTADVKTPEQQKLVVEDVLQGTPADQCGLKSGDVIRKARDVVVRDSADWERALLDMPMGKVIDVSIDRDGRDMTLQFTVGVGRAVPVASSLTSVKRPSNAVPATSASTTTGVPASSSGNLNNDGLTRSWQLLGMRLAELSDRDRQLVDQRYNGGMKVVSVRSGSPAARHGMQDGDILLGLDGYETLGARNLNFILQESRLKKLNALSFQILRAGSGALIGRMDLRQVNSRSGT